MPAVSKAQRRFFGMIEHDPEAVARAGVDMTHKQMHDFAATKEKNLPERKTPFPKPKAKRG